MYNCNIHIIQGVPKVVFCLIIFTILPPIPRHRWTVIGFTLCTYLSLASPTRRRVFSSKLKNTFFKTPCMYIYKFLECNGDRLNRSVVAMFDYGQCRSGFVSHLFHQVNIKWIIFWREATSIDYVVRWPARPSVDPYLRRLPTYVRQ